MTTDQPITHYAELAAQVYNDPPDFGGVKTAARAKLYDGGQVLVFRGTDNFQTWLADLEAAPTRGGQLGVLHAGFYEAWEEVAEQVLGLTTPPSVVVGHSEGGALATLCAGALALAGRGPSQLLTFEPPRLAMDGVLGGILSRQGVLCWASRHAIDPVPWVPSWARLPFAYSDIGHFQVDHLDPIWYHLIENLIPALS